jgi:vitamin B12 transporter
MARKQQKQHAYLLKQIPRLLAMGLTLSCSYGLAGAAESGPEAVRLDALTVTAERDAVAREESVRESPTSTVIIDRETIEATPGDTLVELLQQQGIAVIGDVNLTGEDMIQLRGFHNDSAGGGGKELDGRTIILIDGRRVLTGGALGMIPLLSVERVEILHGPDMIPHSLAAPGGIINVVTRRGRGDKPVSVRLETGLGSSGLHKNNLLISGQKNGFDYSLGLGSRKIGDYHDPNGDRVAYTRTEGSKSVSATLGYSFLNDTQRVSASFWQNKVDKAYTPRSLVQLDALNDCQSADGVHCDPGYAYRGNRVFSLAYDGATQDKRFTWTASHTRGDEWKQAYTQGTKTHPDVTRGMGHEYDSTFNQAQGTYHGDMFDVTLGGQIMHVDNESSQANGIRIHEWDFDNKAAFVLGKLRLLNDSLIFTGGARYDKYKLTDKRYGQRNHPVIKDNYSPKQNFDSWSPSVGVAWLPREWAKLRANYTRGYRVPSGRELFEDNYNFYGYPYNKAEHSDNYEVGFDLTHKTASLSATYFFSDLHNYIYQHNPAVDGHAYVRNAHRQLRSGIELQVSADVAKLAGWDGYVVRPYFGYNRLFKYDEQFEKNGSWDEAWMRGQTTTRSYSVGVRFQHKPSHLASTLSFSHIGPYGNPENASATSPMRGNYNLVNFSLEKQLLSFAGRDTPGGGELSARLEIKNLRNEKYYAASSLFYMPGRSFYAALVYTY